MTTTAIAESATLIGEGNLLVDYHDRLREVIAACVPDPAPVRDPAQFSPGFAVPPLDDDTRRLFGAATARWYHLNGHQGRAMRLLDLAGNPRTQTTKTHASLLIVARALDFIRRTSEPVLIFSPTSANKGTALRDAVARAYETGLATPDQLRIVILAPASSRAKLRSSSLSADPELARRNPVLLHTGPSADSVKTLAREYLREYAAALKATNGINVWFSLELANYVIADAARAFFEQSMEATAKRPRRIHVHAVSSAFGLLGYNVGRQVLEARGFVRAEDRPGFLLVQHLGTPDMVLHLTHGSFDRSGVPAYALDHSTGLYRQSSDPTFPEYTDDPGEVLDPTFYTREPATSLAMDALIARHGGGGIVVSLRECIERYPYLRQMLAGTACSLPNDLRDVREWSLAMALTGAMNGIERRLRAADAPVLVVHNSGSYAVADYRPLEPSGVRSVSDVAGVHEAIVDGF